MISVRSDDKDIANLSVDMVHVGKNADTPNLLGFEDCHSEDAELHDCITDDEGNCESMPLHQYSRKEIVKQSLPQGVRNIDEFDFDDAQCCAEYADDIFEYLFEREKLFHDVIKMPASTDAWIVKIRAILVDWIVDVCIKFKLLSETFFLCVAIMDYAIRQPEMATLTRANIQLFGCCALWIATKIEETYEPECRDFVYISDRAFTKQDLIEMEIRILRATKFQFELPHSLVFLRRFSKAGLSDATAHTLSKYICESCCISGQLNYQFLPSEIAAGAVYLARCSVTGNGWNETLAHYTRCTAERASLISCEIFKYLTTDSTYKACKRKYGTAKLLEVSKLTLKNPKVE